ncbi:MAG: bifunctional glutamate N-acetyltransferase/amino-acid acetyltransferase ArgJ [Candidatus Altiarchaeales archaeon]|nr:bifunctional glutamate N-acetyltransferase/amino-acid acetyltransferase ArgJ [Candidatus Altiarchaeales archaeon]
MDEQTWGVCIPGFKANGLRKDKLGLGIIAADRLCDFAACYTKNHVKAAPVKLMMAHEGPLSAVALNSGNANACVSTGYEDAARLRREVALLLDVSEKEVAVASTGVIGKPMPLEEYVSLSKKVVEYLKPGEEGSLACAQAIMTTDTKAKQHSVEHKGIQVGGVAKGAGMIAPEMATMLCVLTTNADLVQKDLQSCLSKAVEKSFNMTCVDGDMSTNDCTYLLSNRKQSCEVRDFQEALDRVCVNLARQIAWDGEGATKRLTFKVVGAKDERQAKDAVSALCASPLVKTAYHGANPNWGRIFASIGSQVDFNWLNAKITYEAGSLKYAIFSNGKAQEPSGARPILTQNKITTTIDLAQGSAEAEGWGCDLSPEYIRINAEYN